MEEGEPPAGVGLRLVREGSDREREWVQGETPPESVVLKQKPYTRLWVERYARIDPPGLFFYASASDTTPRGSSIEDLRHCTVRTIGTHNGWYLVTLERQGDDLLPDLQDNGASNFCLQNESERDRFAQALRNLAEGAEWDASRTPPPSPAKQSTPHSPAMLEPLNLGSPSFEVERTERREGPVIEGWLEKWNRAKRFDISRSGDGHWQRLYFVLDPKEKGLKYFKANPSQKTGVTWKELLFEHMEDPHKMWDTGAEGEEARDLALQFRFDYRLNDKVYCLRTESTSLREQWFRALESAVRRHHRRRATHLIRAITSGHMPDPSADGSEGFVPMTPKKDRFSFDDVQRWVAVSPTDLDSSSSVVSIRHIGDDGVESERDVQSGETEASEPQPHTGRDNHSSAGLARLQSVGATSSSPGQKRFGKFRKKKSLSATNLEPVSRQICANTRCLCTLRPRHRPGAHGQAPHRCHICWRVYCSDCVRKRNLRGPGTDGKRGPRVVVCDVCYWQYAQPPVRSLGSDGGTSTSSAGESPLPSVSSAGLAWPTGVEPEPEAGPGPEPELEPEKEPDSGSRPATTRERSLSGLQMEEFFIRFEEIKLGRPIDSGAFGTVYRGSYLGPVAVKAIPQRRSSKTQRAAANSNAATGVSSVGADETQQREATALLSGRMVEEIRAQTRFHHQNVVQFLGLAIGKPPHAPGREHWMVVTELCDTNLFALLRSSRSIPWKSRLKIAVDISQGMTYLHDKQKLAHLDLKSPNVLIKGKDAKLADFGSLKRLGGPRGLGVTNEAESTGSESSSTCDTSSAGHPTAATEENFAVGGVGGTAEAQAAALRQVKASQGAEEAGAVLQRMGVPAKAAQIAAGSLHSSLSSASSRATSGHAVGTPEWMAPELLDLGRPATRPAQSTRSSSGEDQSAPARHGVDWQAADRYSFAVVLWELLTRKRPYLGFGGSAAVQAVGPTIVTVWAAEGQRPAFPGAEDGLLPGTTPEPWKALCERCWAEIPADRPEFSDVTQALRAMLPELGSWGDPDRKPDPGVAAGDVGGDS